MKYQITCLIKKKEEYMYTSIFFRLVISTNVYFVFVIVTQSDE